MEFISHDTFVVILYWTTQDIIVNKTENSLLFGAYWIMALTQIHIKDDESNYFGNNITLLIHRCQSWPKLLWILYRSWRIPVLAFLSLREGHRSAGLPRNVEKIPSWLQKQRSYILLGFMVVFFSSFVPLQKQRSYILLGFVGAFFSAFVPIKILGI